MLQSFLGVTILVNKVQTQNHWEIPKPHMFPCRPPTRVKTKGWNGSGRGWREDRERRSKGKNKAMPENIVSFIHTVHLYFLHMKEGGAKGQATPSLPQSWPFLWLVGKILWHRLHSPGEHQNKQTKATQRTQSGFMYAFLPLNTFKMFKRNKDLFHLKKKKVILFSLGE